MHDAIRMRARERADICAMWRVGELRKAKFRRRSEEITRSGVIYIGAEGTERRILQRTFFYGMGREELAYIPPPPWSERAPRRLRISPSVCVHCSGLLMLRFRRG